MKTIFNKMIMTTKDSFGMLEILEDIATIFYDNDNKIKYTFNSKQGLCEIFLLNNKLFIKRYGDFAFSFNLDLNKITKTQYKNSYMQTTLFIKTIFLEANILKLDYTYEIYDENKNLINTIKTNIVFIN